MRSIAGVFPDARVLLSLHPDQLSGFFLFIFRSLPWRNLGAVRRCVQHWTLFYPPEMRGPVADAVIAAWIRLSVEGLLADNVTESAVSHDPPLASNRPTQLRA
jgi:hypothetical protein